MEESLPSKGEKRVRNRTTKRDAYSNHNKEVIVTK